MKRTTLSPRDAAWLADTFARNRAIFGGWSMEGADDKPEPDDAPKDDKPNPDQKPDDKPAGKGKRDDEPLGDGGKRALEAERTARKALEGQLADLKKGLLSALGGDADKSDDDGDAVAKIQQRLDDMQRENAILALANKHRITDEGDLALLAAIKDPEEMKKLAERLAPAEEERTATGRRPKPDRSQGGGGSDSGQSGAKSVAQVMADRRAAREAKAKSTT